MAYANGLIPPSALVTLSSNRLLRADAAHGLHSMNLAFHARFGRYLSITDAYRPLYGIDLPGLKFPHAFSQAGIFEDRYPSTTYLGVNDRRGPWKGKYWWRRPGTAAAAVPGTSQHGWGMALDLGGGVNSYGSVENDWVRANCERFGWWWPVWARSSPSFEPWHFEFVGNVNFPIGGGSGSIDIPTIPGAPGPIQEDSMSAAEVEVLAGHINTVAQEARANQAANAAAIAAVDERVKNLLNTGAYYQVKNPLTGQVVSVIAALTSAWDYAIKAFLRAEAARAAVEALAASQGASPATIQAAVDSAVDAAVTTAVESIRLTVDKASVEPAKKEK